MDAVRVARTRNKPIDLDVSRMVRNAEADAMGAVLADLEKCPKETQAKVRLMCDPNYNYGVSLDLAPLANLISRQRAFEFAGTQEPLAGPDMVGPQNEPR